MVVPHDAVLETPDAVGLAQLTLVLAGRQQAALAVSRQEHGKVTGGMRAIAVDPHHQVGDHVPQLRAALLEPREAFGERANRGVALVRTDRRAHQRAILGEAIHQRIDIASIQRAGIAREQVADAEPIVDRCG